MIEGGTAARDRVGGGGDPAPGGIPAHVARRGRGDAAGPEGGRRGAIIFISQGWEVIEPST